MRVLVVGSGGREHALVWKINQNPAVDKIFALPGNGGTDTLAENVPINPLHLDEVASFAQEMQVDLTVVGPEAPLVAGLTNELSQRGLKVFGPVKEAALIEGSKVFAKYLMEKYGIPTAKAEVFDDLEKARNYLKRTNFPLVVKADGLAGGKGAKVCETKSQAEAALEGCLVAKKFGSAGERVIIEEFLEGEEVSFFALSDGESVLPLLTAQDYKRVFDNDEGPNTGGMGSFSPALFAESNFEEKVMKEIVLPTIEALKTEDRPYQGILYGGLIVTPEGPKVLEFNCRFGDPESQAMLPLLKSDLLEVMLAVVEGNLRNYQLDWLAEKCVVVVAASQGYPGHYKTGFEIHGLEAVEKMRGVEVFLAGTQRANKKLLTNGGRVLNVSARGNTYREAVDLAYQALSHVQFQGIHYRQDIGLKAVNFEEG